MVIGLVKWFDSEKGFGVIGTANGEEYFLHNNSFSLKPSKILKGLPLIFLPKTDNKKNRLLAENSRIIGAPEDWNVILGHLGQNDIVKIEVEITGRNYNGKTFHSKEIQSFSLMGISLKYFFKGKSEEDVLKLILEYYDNELEKKYFIAYCELLEDKLKKLFTSEISEKILNNFFSYLGNNINEELLFCVWKNKKFKYIAYNEVDEFEISESVLKSHLSELGKLELKRILKFSYGSEFSHFFVKYKFSNLDKLSSSELKELYQYIELETDTEQEKRKFQLDKYYIEKIEYELIEKAKQFNEIRNSKYYNECINVMHLIPNEFSDNDKSRIKNEIYNIIVYKCSNEFKSELWIRDIIEYVDFEFVTKYFVSTETQTDSRLKILSKLQVEVEKQFELLKKYSHKFSFEKGFSLLIEYLKKEIPITDKLLPERYFYSISILNDNAFLKEVKGKDLIELFTSYVNSEINEEKKYDFFFKGYIKEIPEEVVLQNLHQINEEQIKLIGKHASKSFMKELLLKKFTLNQADLSWLYVKANIFLDIDSFNFFDQTIFNTIENSEYFKFWSDGKAKIFPDNYISELLQDKFEIYKSINAWIINGATTKQEISSFLLVLLGKNLPITDRKSFFKQFNHIKFLIHLDESHVNDIIQLKNSFYNVVLWFLDKEIDLDFNGLKHKFIYFEPEAQVRILRKLFFLKANGKFDLTISKLEELTRFDLDLYRLNSNFHPEITVDISTDVVIKALMSYQHNNRFIVESELFSVILDDLKFDETRRFKLSNYFEECSGREISEFWFDRIVYLDDEGNYNFKFYYDEELARKLKKVFSYNEKSYIRWNNQSKSWVVSFDSCRIVNDFALSNNFKIIYNVRNKVQKIFFNEKRQYYFAISISPNIKNFYRDRHDNVKYTLEENSNFTHLLSEIKKLPGVKWNNNEKHWGVPASFENEVYEFAFKNNLYLDFTLEEIDKKNLNLYQFRRNDKPNGISFCEGRLANKPHGFFKKEFWWCGGKPCFSKCETIHKSDEWEKYTLLDFCEILGLNTDESNKMGDFIPKGYYYQFISLINRFNRLLERLYCKECDHIFYPVKTANFAANTVVNFHCVNHECSKKDEVIYLNHCLNGLCNSIIDSRVSKKCSNGLHICENCGGCCSHQMLERKLANLELTGGFIHENLKRCVKEKLGHLERGEYFCHKCSSIMIEEDNDLFSCQHCHVSYETSLYKKRAK